MLLAVAAVVIALVVSWCVSRARRLDRLHVRLDAARAALDAALGRRAAVAVRVADGGSTPAAPSVPSAQTRAAADPAVTAPLPALPADAVPALRAAATDPARHAAGIDEREDAESALTRALARVDRPRLPRAVHEELVDAEQLVVLARRVHNDAVRDTLALRSRRLVRWLRLAGTAPEPRYFDIAEPEPDRYGYLAVVVTGGASEAPDPSRTLG
ncbi:MAG: NUDIX hydrolase [Pseudonocardia sp.]